MDALKSLQIAEEYWEQGNSAKALEQYNKILEKVEGSTPMHLGLQSKILSRMVDIFRNVGPPETGIKYATRALEIDRQLYPEEGNDVAADLLDLAQLHKSTNNLKKALEYLQESVKVDLKLPPTGPHAPLKAFRRISGAQLLNELGFIEQAAKQCIEAIPDVKKNVKDNHLLGFALAQVADCLQDIGEHNIAEEYLLESINLEYLNHYPNKINLGTRFRNLSLLLFDTGRFEEAISVMKKARKYHKVLRGSKNQREQILKKEIENYKNWMKERKGKYDIFLSYNTENETFAEKLHNLLETYGLNVFTFREDPRSNAPLLMTELLMMLKEHLQQAKSMLIIATETSLTSVAVRLELTIALDRNIPVFAWYPNGNRITPKVSAVLADNSEKFELEFVLDLFHDRVRHYYGLGINGESFEDFSLALLYRYLLLSPKHPLRAKFNVLEMKKSVRHATRLRPFLVDKDGQLIGFKE